MEQGEGESSTSPSDQEKDVLVRKKMASNYFTMLAYNRECILLHAALPILHQ